MYFNSKIHILSNALILISLVNVAAEGLSGGIRMIFNAAPSLLPDMMNVLVRNSSIIVALLKLIVVSLIFYLSWKKLDRFKALVDDDDREEMGRLQAEFLKDNKSTLTVEAIEQLLRVWAVILIGVELVYDITSEGYARFIEQLSGLVNYHDPVSVELFVSLYNNSHGYKYIGMLIAILLGVVVTGIFLKDRILIIIAGCSTLVFLVAFFSVQSGSFMIFNRLVGIVWTSVIFHSMQTAGMLVFSLYIRHSYRGL